MMSAVRRTVFGLGQNVDPPLHTEQLIVSASLSRDLDSESVEGMVRTLAGGRGIRAVISDVASHRGAGRFS